MMQSQTLMIRKTYAAFVESVMCFAVLGRLSLKPLASALLLASESRSAPALRWLLAFVPFAGFALAAGLSCKSVGSKLMAIQACLKRMRMANTGSLLLCSCSSSSYNKFHSCGSQAAPPAQVHHKVQSQGGQGFQHALKIKQSAEWQADKRRKCERLDLLSGLKCIVSRLCIV